MRKPILFLLFICGTSLFSDSLWQSDFQGYYTEPSVVQVGDTIFITIELDSKLKYNASRVDSEGFSIELSGGDTGDLFSFLPSGRSGGNQSIKGSEEISLSARLAASIISRDRNGIFTIRGSKTVIVQGKSEVVSIRGFVDPYLLDESRQIPLSQIADARLVYNTMLESGAPILSEGDIVWPEEAAEVPETADVDTAEAVPPVEDAAGDMVTVHRPHVIRDRCIGCGICEYQCPLNGQAAIRVYAPTEFESPITF